jgi:predicted nucleotidyltransferase
MNQKEIDITAKIKNRISQKNPEAQVILFGSHARGQANINSDWDILILLNQQNVNRTIEREYRDELFDIELEIGEPISTFVFSKFDWESKFSVTPLFENIKKDGIYL